MSDTPAFPTRLFASGSIAFVLLGTLAAAYGVALPAFARNFGLAPGVSSLILSAQSAGAVIVVAAGTMGLRGLDARLSAALMLAGGALVAAGITWPLTLLGAFVGGAGFGITAVYVNRAFLQGFGSRGQAMVGLVNAVSGIGLIGAPLFYVAVGGSVAALFGTISVLAAVTLVLYRPGEDSFAGAPRGLPDLGRGRLGIVALNFGSALMESSLGGLGAVALIASGWAENVAALLVSGFFATFLLSRLVIYWIAARVSAARLFLVGTVGTALASGLAASGLDAVGYILAGGFIGLVFPSFYVWGSQVLGPDPRMGSSILLAGMLGGALGPLMAGAILRVIGLPMLFALVAATGAFLSAVIAWIMFRPRPPALAGA